MVVPAALSRRAGASGSGRRARRVLSWRRLGTCTAILLLSAGLPAAPARAAAAPFPPPQLTEEQAVEIALGVDEVARWLDRYPTDPDTDATFDEALRRWTVKVWSGRAGQIAQATVDDRTRAVTDVRVGPQVAWEMARGRPGAFGGRTLTSWPVWLALSLVFFVGLADLRRPLRLRNLDLLALLGFGIPLALFSHGRVFSSVSLATVPLLYLAVRTCWIGLRSRPLAPAAPVLPVWALLAATLFLVGFRIGLDVQTPRW